MLVWLWMSKEWFLLGVYVKKSLQICADWAINRPETGATSGLNWYCIAHWKIIIFGGLIAQWVSFKWALELLNVKLCAQIYDQFTEDCAEYVKTGSICAQGTLQKNWYWLGHWKIVIFGMWIYQWVIFQSSFWNTLIRVLWKKL